MHPCRKYVVNEINIPDYLNFRKRLFNHALNNCLCEKWEWSGTCLLLSDVCSVALSPLSSTALIAQSNAKNMHLLFQEVLKQLQASFSHLIFDLVGLYGLFCNIHSENLVLSLTLDTTWQGNNARSRQINHVTFRAKTSLPIFASSATVQENVGVLSLTITVRRNVGLHTILFQPESFQLFCLFVCLFGCLFYCLPCLYRKQWQK